MAITVRELLAIPHLPLNLHSGDEGLERKIVWTHASDLPRPWEWLGRDELLMTNGMNFPRRADEQEDLVNQLSRAGASALAIGENMYCPPLTRRFTRASEQLGLPVLWIGYPLPFVAISRAVAEATMLEQSQRLMQTARIYDAIRTSAASHDDQGLTEALTRELKCPVHLCDRETGEPWFPRSDAAPSEVTDAVRRAAHGEANRIAGARSVMLDSGEEVLIVDVPTHRQTALVVVRSQKVQIDGTLLQHAATVIALDFSLAILRREYVQRERAEDLGQMLDSRADQQTARRHLAAADLDPADSLVGALAGAPAERMRDIHLRLWRRQIPHLVTNRSGVAHVVVPVGEAATAALVDAIGAVGFVGLSAPLRVASRVSEASREALWALSITARTEQQVARFGDVPHLSWVNGIEEAQSIVDQVLGKLLAHDVTHEPSLVETLEVFLEHRRSWQATAAVLHVHRQTVRYRMRKVEEITGRTTSETSDVAQFWLALQTRRQLAGRG